MAKGSQKSRVRRAHPSSAVYKARSRTRIAKLAAAGQGWQALSESVSLLGIDLERGDKLRLTRVRNFRIG